VAQLPLSRPSGEEAASYDLIESARGRANIVDRQELGSERQLPNSDSSSSDSRGSKSFWTTGNIILFVLFQFALGLSVILLFQFLRGFKLYSFLERISIEVPEAMERGIRRIGIPPPDFLLNWIFYMKLPALSRSYLEINHALDRVGRKPMLQDTPSERVNSLIFALPATAAPAERLLTEYQTSVYSLHPADPEIARKAATEIRILSWREWLRQYIAHFKLPGRHG
jgi:hypothetical protein